jgi:mannan endo-1,4-beta-mannosidase
MKYLHNTFFVFALFLGACVSENLETQVIDPGPDLPEKVQGIRVKDGKLIDAAGEQFIPYGFNSVHVWLNEDAAREALKTSIPASGANTVRMVTSGQSWIWNNQSRSAAQKRELVELAISAGLVPMLEMHDGTCLNECDFPAKEGKMGIEQIVDEWLQPENRKLMEDYEGELLVNIANEWGPEDSVYLECYKRAITRFRRAGVRNVLVIDAGRCGQGANTLLQFGDALYEHDSLKNIVLSIHLYGLWRTADREFSDWTPPYLVEEVIPQLAALKAPVVIGELGWKGEGSAINYNPEKLLEVARQHEIGWLFWAWYDGEEKPFYNTISTDDYSLSSDEDLSEAGSFLVNDTDYGLRNIAKKPAGFTGD